MENYYDNLRSDSYPEIGPAQLPTWCAFALGGIVTFLFVYIGIARPAAREMSLMRRQMSTLEQSVWEVAGQKDAAESTNQLLSLLTEQRTQAIAAKESLGEMRELHQQLLVEAERVQNAMAAVSQLGSLKDMLLANSDRAEQAAEVLSISEDIYHRLANAANTTDLARQAGSDLLALRDDLIERSDKVEEAKENLDQLIDINTQLNDGANDSKNAKDKATDLIALKDTIVNQTDNLAEAIETLELTNELGARFHEAALSFDNIRHWMVEVVAMEPMLQRARQTIEPLIDFGNLRRMAPEQIRQIAKSFTRQYEAHIARTPEVEVNSDVNSDLSIETAALDGTVTTE